MRAASAAIRKATNRSLVGRLYDRLVRSLLKATYSFRMQLAVAIHVRLGTNLERTFLRLGL